MYLDVFILREKYYMVKNIQAIRGMNDYLPIDTDFWQWTENILKQILINYGYREIRLPIIESTSLFQRAIGKVTDVVEKEMYTFNDRNCNSLTLRPEGTAGCVRACIEHGIIHNQEKCRLWYIGPMFRRERPQKGRYRQFHQIGVEVFGLEGPDIDVELILLNMRFWKELGISDYLNLELNSIGSLESRINYRNILIDFLKKHENQLDEDSKHRMYTNPMRLLDSKNINIQNLLKFAPKPLDYLDKESRCHFNDLCLLLDNLGIKYTINPSLVRGLDYYNRTVIEWITDKLGTQSTICGGGRYDSLVEQLGGRSTAAIGFAIGIERLILLIQKVNYTCKPNIKIDVCIVAYGIGTQLSSIKLSEELHNYLPGLKLINNFGTGNFKKQFLRAKKFSARFVLILGENEVNNGYVILKNFTNGNQQRIIRTEIITTLRMLL